jgi:hypothetical protein
LGNFLSILYRDAHVVLEVDPKKPTLAEEQGRYRNGANKLQSTMLFPIKPFLIVLF